MRKLRKPPVKEVKTSKKEPLAEGLQVVVPTDCRGRRLWSRMSDEEIVAFTQKLIDEKGISRRYELDKIDGWLCQVLRKRGLLDEVEFEEEKRYERSWKGMSDEDIVEYALKLMKEKGICGKIELCKEDQGLYNILHRRGLISKIGFNEKSRAWREMSDEEIIEVAMRLMKENNVTGKKELNRADRGVYEILRRRKLLDKINFSDKCKWEDRRDWSSMSNEEIVNFAEEVVKKKKITGRGKLAKVDSGLYEALRERKLLGRVFAPLEQQKDDCARDAVIDALTEFAKSEKPEVEVA